MGKLLENVSSVDWSVIDQASSVNEQEQRFNSFLVQLFDVHQTLMMLFEKTYALKT